MTAVAALSQRSGRRILLATFAVAAIGSLLVPELHSRLDKRLETIPLPFSVSKFPLDIANGS